MTPYRDRLNAGHYAAPKQPKPEAEKPAEEPKAKTGGKEKK